MDQVFIQELHVKTVIGIYDWERTEPREIILNVTLFTDIKPAEKSDNISDCVSYELVADKIRKLASTSNRQTVEALAGDIAHLCLKESYVKGVRVRVDKPSAIEHAVSVGVEIERYNE